MTCSACLRLGQINRDLAAENARLDHRNEQLESENQNLRIELATVGNGKRIPRGNIVIVHDRKARYTDPPAAATVRNT